MKMSLAVLFRALILTPILAIVFVVPSYGQSIGTKKDEYDHEYSELKESKLEIRDFDFQTLTGGRIKLSEAIEGRKLVIVTYFAAWCHNSKYDFETLNELYKKYADQGLSVIGICEYSSRKALKTFIEEMKPEYPICIEGDFEKLSRTASSHYAYRNKFGDTRIWGTPFTMVFTTDEFKKGGEIISTRQLAATGELMKLEAEAIIREKLAIK